MTAGYDPHAFEPFAVTVDLAVFTVRAGALHVLLIRRGQEPYAGTWALPGGFVLPRESAETAARRELAEETGLAPGVVAALHLEQLRTYSDPDRDPRMRVVSVAFTALVPDMPEPAAGGGGDADRARWVPVGEAAGPGADAGSDLGAGAGSDPGAGTDLGAGAGADPGSDPGAELGSDPGAGSGLAFDHAVILADARERVGSKLEYTCLASAFCPPEFTLGELQAVYETVWDTALDRPNFRRKVLATPGFVEAVPGAARLTGGRGKPAALYRPGPATTLHPPLLRPSEGSTR
ncbi:NUDIX hydrolase [Streptomyces sp. CJ_13]|uniref:NUDIX hydrolase n=1 Tax=Streptomyces sp. CJ_13 TaxID=2724943 RepID=UPI001BDCAD37|nr:NUDIX hydrolase [Streptomyces sp. CJ_13]MBT1188874.1 NUDIX hydrolase [Streptomyces sp. CJ_13]